MKRKKTGKERHIVWERDNYTCRYCGLYMRELYLKWKNKEKWDNGGRVRRKTSKLTADHIVPRRFKKIPKNILNNRINLNTCCSSCEKKKGGDFRFLLVVRHIAKNIYLYVFN